MSDPKNIEAVCPLILVRPKSQDKRQVVKELSNNVYAAAVALVQGMEAEIEKRKLNREEGSYELRLRFTPTPEPKKKGKEE